MFQLNELLQSFDIQGGETPAQEAKTIEDVENALTGLDAMAIVVGLVAVDLLGRIFCLSDVTNNSENFGFAGRQVCIVDFLTKTKTYYQEEYLWEGFLRGSSRYVYSHALTRYVLASRTELERVKVAVRV